MSSTFYAENLKVSAITTFSNDIIFDEATNNLTLAVADQATGVATLTIPDLGGVNQNIAPFLPTGAADNELVRMNGTTGIQSSTNVTLTDGDVFQGVVGVTALAANNLTITAAASQNIVMAVGSGQNVTVTGGGLTVAQDLAVAGDAIITGDLTVNGTTTSVNSTVVTIADNNLLLSSNYTTVSARAGGITVNYLPTATTAVVSGAAFASTTTVNAAGGAFAANDLILVTGANTVNNNGLYQVVSYADPLITISGSPVGNFLQSIFVVDATAAGTVTKVTVAVLQAGTDGKFEVASGSTSSAISFTDIALVSDLPSGTWIEVDVNTMNATPSVTNIPTISDRSITFELVYAVKENGASNALNGKIVKSFHNAAGTLTAMGSGSRDESVLANGANWTLTVTASGANIVVTLTGEAATDIDWRLLYRDTESPAP